MRERQVQTGKNGKTEKLAMLKTQYMCTLLNHHFVISYKLLYCEKLFSIIEIKLK